MSRYREALRKNSFFCLRRAFRSFPRRAFRAERRGKCLPEKRPALGKSMFFCKKKTPA